MTVSNWCRMRFHFAKLYILILARYISWREFTGKREYKCFCCPWGMSYARSEYATRIEYRFSCRKTRSKRYSRITAYIKPPKNKAFLHWIGLPTCRSNSFTHANPPSLVTLHHRQLEFCPGKTMDIVWTQSVSFSPSSVSSNAYFITPYYIVDRRHCQLRIPKSSRSTLPCIQLPIQR